MNIALFPEDVTEFNGALMFIPRSHKAGVIEAGHGEDDELSALDHRRWDYFCSGSSTKAASSHRKARPAQ